MASRAHAKDGAETHLLNIELLSQSCHLYPVAVSRVYVQSPRVVRVIYSVLRDTILGFIFIILQIAKKKKAEKKLLQE